MVDLRVQIGGGLELKNPVTTASGTFGFGQEFTDFIDLNELGGIFVKGLTLKLRQGNDYPRMAETPSGMLNAVGLQNKGIDYFIETTYPDIKKYKTEIFPNINGSVVEDYIAVAEKVNEIEGINALELNISCPNVKKGGLAFGTDPIQVEKLTSTLRKLTDKPLMMKLTPNVTDITAVAKAAEQGGADALSCINTVMGMAVDIHKRKPSIPAVTGGLSGPAIKPVGVAAVWRVSKAVKIPVIGLGGIMNADDAVEYLLAGASALQIGTANFIDPDVSSKVLEGIKTYMTQAGFTKISDFHGYF